MKTCSVDGCEKPALTKGLCSMHYTRLRRHGTLDGLHPQGDPLDRLMAKVEKEPDGGCWIYVGRNTKNGYAVVGEGRAGWHYGHRLAYERLVGPIPSGQRLHHSCENPRCVNPSHLSPSTAAEHARHHGLGDGPCKACGAEDWYTRKDNGSRQCRECKRRRRRSAC